VSHCAVIVLKRFVLAGVSTYLMQGPQKMESCYTGETGFDFGFF